jgi:hypothetical protein
MILKAILKAKNLSLWKYISCVELNHERGKGTEKSLFLA